MQNCMFMFQNLYGALTVRHLSDNFKTKLCVRPESLIVDTLGGICTNRKTVAFVSLCSTVFVYCLYKGEDVLS
jgi:hypothetical protein